MIELALRESFAFELHAELDAIHARHVEIDQHHVRLLSLDLCQGLFAVVGDANVGRTDDLPHVEHENLCEVHIIVDDQHRQRLFIGRHWTVAAWPLIPNRAHLPRRRFGALDPHLWIGAEHLVDDLAQRRRTVWPELYERSRAVHARARRSLRGSSFPANGARSGQELVRDDTKAKDVDEVTAARRGSVEQCFGRHVGR